MKIYHYDKKSGVLTSVGVADADPMQPGGWLVPLHATAMTPPRVAEGQVAVFEDGFWAVKDDVRGDWYDSDGELVRVERLDADVAALVRELVREARPSACHVLEAGVWCLSRRLADEALAGQVAARLGVLRGAREVVLNRLIGLVVSLLPTQEVAKRACQQARQELLDMPQHPALTAAATLAGLNAAIEEQQVVICAGLHETLQKVFAGVRL